jgi:hypothetical protein
LAVQPSRRFAPARRTRLSSSTLPAAAATATAAVAVIVVAAAKTATAAATYLRRSLIAAVVEREGFGALVQKLRLVRLDLHRLAVGAGARARLAFGGLADAHQHLDILHCGALGRARRPQAGRVRRAISGRVRCGPHEAGVEPKAEQGPRRTYKLGRAPYLAASSTGARTGQPHPCAAGPWRVRARIQGPGRAFPGLMNCGLRVSPRALEFFSQTNGRMRGSRENAPVDEKGRRTERERRLYP